MPQSASEVAVVPELDLLTAVGTLLERLDCAQHVFDMPLGDPSLESRVVEIRSAEQKATAPADPAAPAAFRLSRTHH